MRSLKNLFKNVALCAVMTAGCVSNNTRNKPAKVDYTLDDTRTFADYTPEQRVQMLKDYRATYGDVDILNRTFPNYRLMAVVEEAYPGARVKRLTASGRKMAAEDGEPFSESEQTALKGIFGDSLSMRGVTKRLSHTRTKKEIERDTLAVTLDDMQVVFYTPLHSKDYALEKDALRYGSLFHEATHLWQLQNYGRGNMNILFCLGKHESPYYYPLAEHITFEMLCAEQQASAVENYARRFLHEKRAPLYRAVDMTGGKAEERLKEMIEEAFPEARKTRLAVEKKRREQRHAPRP